VTEIRDPLLVERYRLDAVLAEEATNVVYRGWQLDLERPVAIKLLKIPARDAPELGERLARIAKGAAKIKHPGVAAIYEHATSDDGRPFIAMELLEGETLEALLARKGKLEPGEAVPIAASIASALGALHSEGLVHGSLSPAKVMLVENSGAGLDVKLVGLGLAHAVEVASISNDPIAKQTLRGLGPAERESLPAVAYGSPETISPEQLLGTRLDARSDIYALGAVIYRMLTGRPPFADASWERVVARHLVEAPEPMRRRVPELPPRLDQVVLRAMEKDPEKRFAVASELSSALWWALAPSSSRPDASPEPLEQERAPSPRRSRAGAAVAIGAALLAIGASGLWLARGGEAGRAEQPEPAPPATRVAVPTAVEQPAPAPTPLPPPAEPVASAAEPEPPPRARAAADFAPPAGARASVAPARSAPAAPAVSGAKTPSAALPSDQPEPSSDYSLDDLKSPYR
jgi:eukaryotic-like serine/threonine-protein kinase